MARKSAKQAADYIRPLYMNGLSGRLLHLPAPAGKKAEILFIYGQHSSLERWYGLAQALNRYGAVTVVDMPGFGGMTSLYKIGQKATVDELADYLAAFFKLKYRNKKIHVVGMSLGFVIVTRMLQKYPKLTKNVDMLVSVVGFGHHDDFLFKSGRKLFYKSASRLFSLRLPAWFFQSVFLQPFYLRRAYKHSRFAKEKLAKMSGDEFKRTMDMEVELWRINDLRTQMKTNFEMFTLDNTKRRVDLPLYHVASKHDRYFDHNRVEEHLRRIFSDFQLFYTTDPNHAPTIIADARAAAPFIPNGLRAILRDRNRESNR
ncbi:MAG TPA: alpha/beta hydrolase [Candidatus Saccharimonadales bacterium]|nr:alpha/beta hydrolase [Candidatus Saccharimonadales bacterium]